MGLPRGTRRMIYATEPYSELGLFLTKIHEERKTAEIVTTINFKEVDLASRPTAIIEAPPVPFELDYTFNSLTDPSRKNFKVISRQGGYVGVCKEALFLASHYFRNRLTAFMTEYTEEIGTVQAIETALTHLITGCYKPPSKMTPSLASDIIQLAQTYRSNDLNALKNSIERHCHEELSNNTEDLNFVVRLLITANDGGLAGLQNACVGCIITFHFQQFLTDYLLGNHSLRERLTIRQGIARPALGVIVKKAFVQQLQVRRFIRQIPTNLDE
ncbi:unnamed protein product [Caenorhabditis bovis]|uniref:BTB domain-containing protein n=1 Tax=Caenorhabditis bovis TaxID=2654633 RepID=A0A8S1F9Z2_9PELO|nr:unnamed protein product [Caenorhabditis bovis]